MGREKRDLHVSGSPRSPKIRLKKANLEMLSQLGSLTGLYTFKMNPPVRACPCSWPGAAHPPQVEEARARHAACTEEPKAEGKTC